MINFPLYNDCFSFKWKPSIYLFNSCKVFIVWFFYFPYQIWRKQCQVHLLNMSRRNYIWGHDYTPKPLNLIVLFFVVLKIQLLDERQTQDRRHQQKHVSLSLTQSVTYFNRWRKAFGSFSGKSVWGFADVHSDIGNPSFQIQPFNSLPPFHTLNKSYSKTFGKIESKRRGKLNICFSRSCTHPHIWR